MSRNGGERLASLLTAGKAATNPQDIAVHSSTIRDLIDGAIVQSAVFGSTQPIIDARHAASRLLELTK